MADSIRAQLAQLLDWEEAHVGFDTAVGGIPPDHRGLRPPGFEHSAWQLLEHLRIAQWDLLDFCTNTAYRPTMTWPDDYWPSNPAPPDDAAWDASIAAFHRDQATLKALVADERFDLFEPVPTGKPNQTGLRAVLLAADHNAYHVGQLVAVRRALGIWP